MVKYALETTQDSNSAVDVFLVVSKTPRRKSYHEVSVTSSHDERPVDTKKKKKKEFTTWDPCSE
jgi:hypothetical protein